MLRELDMYIVLRNVCMIELYKSINNNIRCVYISCFVIDRVRYFHDG